MKPFIETLRVTNPVRQSRASSREESLAWGRVTVTAKPSTANRLAGSRSAPYQRRIRGNGPSLAPLSEGGAAFVPNAGITPRASNLPACHRKAMDRVRDSAQRDEPNASDGHVRICWGLGWATTQAYPAH